MKFFVWEKEIEFDEVTKQLKFDDKIINPAVRTFGDMKELYKSDDTEILEEIDENTGLYFMFRWVYLSKEDEELFAANNMRYDVTVIIPFLVWDEFNKTYGHYHPAKSDGKRYEEIYEVLAWSALFLQQNKDEVNYTDSFLWDKVVMNEWFWHVTINPSDEEILVMANIVDWDFSSEYWDYKEKFWANYYYKTSWFEKNPNYKNNLEITEKEDFFEWSDMYEQFLFNPEKFNFLH